MSKPMGHYRLASTKDGDDVTRARYVRTSHDAVPAERKRRKHKPRLPGFEASFIQEGRTKFSKAVQSPNDHILVSGHNNIKIGRTVRKGHLRGYWIYTLSLEERKTCPRSCQHWQSCYGNNMPFAKRVDHTAPDFLTILEAAIAKVCKQAAKRGSGALIRLHALGDFFSVEYVGFWRGMLLKHENLAIYGYTAHDPLSVIGMHIQSLRTVRRGAAMIRFSNGGLGDMSTVSIGSPESCPPNAFVCPEQTGRTLGCDTCGACWGTSKNVAFLEH